MNQKLGSIQQPLFALGEILATDGARRAIRRTKEMNEIVLLFRHQSGDWGEIDTEDVARNARALRDNTRIASCYAVANNVNVWVTTEGDRSVTVLFLSDELNDFTSTPIRPTAVI